MKRHRWQSYRAVRAWCLLHGEFEHRARVEMQRAAMEGAPLDAVYKDKDSGEWLTLDQIAPDAAAQIRREMSE